MQCHWKPTRRARKYRKWYYGNRDVREPNAREPIKQKMTRLEVLAERKRRWEELHENH